MWPWGEPRSTQDVDLVIHLKAEQVNKLSAELEKIEIFLPPDIILENLMDTRGDLPINAVHGHSGYKAEMFLVQEHDSLRNLAFSRRISVDFGNEIGRVFVHSPEDIILYKLIYYSLSTDMLKIGESLYSQEVYLFHYSIDRDALTFLAVQLNQELR